MIRVETAVAWGKYSRMADIAKQANAKQETIVTGGGDGSNNQRFNRLKKDA
jgi:diacylglycerol kinase family enzyme